MNRKNPRTQLTVHVWACSCVALVWLSAAMLGAWPPVAAAQPDAPENDLEIPTPSPSDLPPPEVAPEEPPAAEFPGCDPVTFEAAPATCCPVRCRPMMRRCRPRVRCRRVLRRRVVCCPCPAVTPAPAAPVRAEQAQADPWRPLFDGETLKNWKATRFGGEGEVDVRDGMIVMDIGHDMTGITFNGKLPKTNYELQLQGKRLGGHDFFCTTTFPVGEEHCSLVIGGWGGTVVGLSNVDFYDASDNFTTTFHDFKDETWYTVRVRVSDHKITAWIDDNQVVAQPREGHRFDVRFEVELSRPLGVSTWQTSGAVRDIRLRDLEQEEVAADMPEDAESR